MLSVTKRKFLFKCDECSMILSVEFDDKEDLEKVMEDEMILECPCGGHCFILRD